MPTIDPAQPLSEPATYEIVRFSRGQRGQRIMRSGLTLAEAQAHCQNPTTRGDDWFDGFRNTDPNAQRAFVERDLCQFKAAVRSGLATPSPRNFRPMLPDVEDQ